MAIERERYLVLAFHCDRLTWVVKDLIWPKFEPCSGAFVLEPLDAKRTRLIFRSRFAFRPTLPHFVCFSEMADSFFQHHQFRGIRWRSDQAVAPAE